MKSTCFGRDKSQDIACFFDHLLSEGKVSAAIRLLTTACKEGALPPDSLVPPGSDSSGNQSIVQDHTSSWNVATPNSLLDSSLEGPSNYF